MDNLLILHNTEMKAYSSVAGIDYDYMLTSQPVLGSLRDLCANKILSAGILLRINCLDLPQPLRNLLIHFAISCGCRRSLTALLNSWSREVFLFEPPVPIRTWKVYAVRHNFSSIFKTFEISGMLQHIVEHFMSSFVSDCQSGSPIRCLDFSAFPIGRNHLQNICNVISEKCRLYSEIFTCRDNGGTAKRKRCSDDQGSTNKCTIKMNCNINYQNIDSLCSMLSLIKVSNIHLEILIAGLHIIKHGIQGEHVSRLIALLEPEALDAFSWCDSYFSNFHDNFYLLQQLKSFPNLRALHFEISFHPDHYSKISELTAVVCELTNLKNFSLEQWNCVNVHDCLAIRAAESIPLRLPFINEQLECLSLKGCNISAEDLTRLSMSSLRLVLKTLNMSRSKLDLQSLVSVLTEYKNLRVLCLDECKFLNGNVDLLFRAFSGMKKLKSLSIQRMDMNSEELLSKVTYISHMRSLQHISISPIGLKSNQLRSFRSRFKQTLDMSWNCPSRTIVMFAM